MVLHADLFGFGYGMFCCNSGEHLNKMIKTCELNETNMDSKRFYTITHLMRSKQFVFTSCVLPTNKSKLQCSACKEFGHNKKNKSCPMHPSHPAIVFDSTDDEI